MNIDGIPDNNREGKNQYGSHQGIMKHDAQFFPWNMHSGVFCF